MGAALPLNSTRVSPVLVGNWPSVYCAAASVAGPSPERVSAVLGGTGRSVSCAAAGVAGPNPEPKMVTISPGATASPLKLAALTTPLDAKAPTAILPIGDRK